MKKLTQIQMADALGVTPGYMSEVLSGKHPISRPLAEKLADMFPSKSFREWRRAEPADIRRAFLFFHEVD